MRDLRRKLLSLGNHFFERLKTANFSTACGTSTLKSLPSRAFFVSDVHLRPRKHFSRCTLAALRGFEAGPRALATAALYLVLLSNGLHHSENLPVKFDFSPKSTSTNIAKKLPLQRCFKPLLITLFNFSHKRPTFAFFGAWSWVLPKNAESLRDSDALMRVAVPRRRGPAGLRDLFRFCRNRDLYIRRS